jgi:hypothetical protein
MTQAQRFQINEPHVVAEVIDGEAIVINLDSGNYFSLRETAASIWQVLMAGNTSTEVSRRMSRDYAGEPDAIEAAIQTFIENLLQEGLIQAVDSYDNESTHPDTENTDMRADGKPPFQNPELEKFTDMADLLLLDPIHEVDAQGWPRAGT